MINEEKVILMTRLASYEKREGKNNMAIGKYFRGDFVSLHLLKAVIAATICYFVGFGLYLLYFIEELVAKIYEIDFVLFAKNANRKHCLQNPIHQLVSIQGGVS